MDKAKKWRVKIFHATGRLKTFPKLGKLVQKPKFKKLNIRFLVEDKYKIFYRIMEEEVEILNVADSRRNPDDLIY